MHRSTGHALMVAAFVSFATAANAQSVQEKLCIFSAAEKLPNIPGLSIAASRTKTGIAPLAAAQALVESFAARMTIAYPMDAAQWLNRNFGQVIAEWKIKQAIESGRRTEVAQELTNELKNKIRGSILVEIDVRAAAQDVTFAFVCAWGDWGSRVTVSTGVLR